MSLKRILLIASVCLPFALKGQAFKTCCPQNITVDSAEVIVGHASGYQSTNTTIQSRNASITRTAVGRYTVIFFTPHPDGSNYEVLFGSEEDGNRDIPKQAVIEGTRTANGFQMTNTVDDNGGGADVYNDEPWSFFVPRTRFLPIKISN